MFGANIKFFKSGTKNTLFGCLGQQFIFKKTVLYLKSAPLNFFIAKFGTKIKTFKFWD